MKAVLIVHNTAIEPDVAEILHAVGISSYTKFPEILGKGELSEPHLKIEVWPETNCGTLVVTDSDKAAKLMEHVRQARQKLGSEGIKAFVWQIDDIT